MSIGFAVLRAAPYHRFPNPRIFVVSRHHVNDKMIGAPTANDILLRIFLKPQNAEAFLEFSKLHVIAYSDNDIYVAGTPCRCSSAIRY